MTEYKKALSRQKVHTIHLTNKTGFIDVPSAREICILNGIECCQTCQYYDYYTTDIEAVWLCPERDGIDLMEGKFINTFKEINCESYATKYIRGPINDNKSI